MKNTSEDKTGFVIVGRCLIIAVMILFVVGLLHMVSSKIEINAYNNAYNKAMDNFNANNTTPKVDVLTGETVVFKNNKEEVVGEGYGKVVEKNTDADIHMRAGRYTATINSFNKYGFIVEDIDGDRSYYEVPKSTYMTLIEGDYIKFKQTLTEIIEVDVISEEEYNNIFN